ncbi:Xylose isomerase-like TIM barrel [Gaiella occulta]|uniref:Xylose isomerase-like TIM barrel n=1 Tax=Gaiella occulta TaxID=1002870 RepID=A0A7M2YYN8_9ACTN|nr:sugar phosphate isomerase/epimerase family protein [Gaiella occulta]RDI75277.1 Xylose isomerase-like TIM barrel [Gaiella occulta]
MRLGLSEISTVTASFADDVAAYAAAGFDAIGLWEFKLPADDEANAALLREHGLRVANCVPAVPSLLPLAIPGMEGPDDPDERIEALCASVRRLAAYEPECVACLAGPLGGRTEDEGRAVLLDGLRRIADTARAAGVRIGFEPIHPTQRDSAGFVNSLAAADALLAAAGAPEIGILFDTYHLWDDPDVLSWIASNSGRVAGVHVSDWPARDRSDRVLPGEGISRTRDLVDALATAGWDGALDVEIFSTPDLFWGLPVDIAAQRAYAAAAALL